MLALRQTSGSQSWSRLSPSPDQDPGRRGGMKTIGIATLHSELDADIVVRSLEDLPPDAFDRLLGA